ncbi:hypothetical protein [Ponticaulis profundi]|uniref:Uncharacterized protein n=1 Tax=Ponticaulis profundi TaxID=2665222 RepID=A0ABW1SCD2_9PROT
MDPGLSAKQRAARLDQSAQAYENNRRNELELEARAASLIAHGDYIAHEIEKKRKDGRWITEADLAGYVATALEHLYPASRVIYDPGRSLLDVRLDSVARSSFRNWCETRRADGGELVSKTEAASFRLGKESSRKRLPRLTTNHPFVRFLFDGIEDAGGVPESAFAIRLQAAEIDLPPGFYAGVVQEWRFGTDQIDARLVWRLLDARSGELLSPDQAESAIRTAVERGAPLAGLREELDLHGTADFLEGLVEGQLMQAFDDAAERREDELEDRLTIQMASLDRAETRDIARIERVIEKAGSRMEAANRGRLRALQERIADRRLQLQRRVSCEREAMTVAAIVIKVEEQRQ